MNHSTRFSAMKPGTGAKLASTGRDLTGKSRESIGKVLKKAELEVQDDSDHFERKTPQSVGEFKTAFCQYTRFHPFA